MGNVSVVIGANYGDEGKGLVTDYLSTKDTTVIRFNGGAQAGHTVVTPDGKRHVFHHFGSGSFAEAKTYLSPFFIVNPIMFAMEKEELEKIKVYPEITVDQHCPVTTPFDIMLNQAKETFLGNKRHGSCGLGINETIQRDKEPQFRLRVNDLIEPNFHVKRILNKIMTEWVPQRVKVLGLPEIPSTIYNTGLIERWLEDVESFFDFTSMGEWNRSTDLDSWGPIVFEGAQGLRLDQDNINFPHVTHSKTGLTNVVSMLNWADYKKPIDVYYVTRTYLTRHGNGPLPSEVSSPDKIYKNIKDDTNVANQHQGVLRYGYLDWGRFNWEVELDLQAARSRIEVRPAVVITCMDQLNENGKIILWRGGNLEECTLEELSNKFYFIWKKKLLASYGPTREDVRVIQ
jgi:adenylosuccinate synthase